MKAMRCRKVGDRVRMYEMYVLMGYGLGTVGLCRARVLFGQAVGFVTGERMGPMGLSSGSDDGSRGVPLAAQNHSYFTLQSHYSRGATATILSLAIQ